MSSVVRVQPSSICRRPHSHGHFGHLVACRSSIKEYDNSSSHPWSYVEPAHPDINCHVVGPTNELPCYLSIRNATLWHLYKPGFVCPSVLTRPHAWYGLDTLCKVSESIWPIVHLPLDLVQPLQSSSVVISSKTLCPNSQLSQYGLVSL